MKRKPLDWMTRRMVLIVFATAVGIAVASADQPFSAEQIALFGKCEKSTPASRIRLIKLNGRSLTPTPPQ